MCDRTWRGHVTKTAKITCPSCGHQAVEPIPEDQCLVFYECRRCLIVLRPKPGDCCVFCSYADQRCLSAQIDAYEATRLRKKF